MPCWCNDKHWLTDGRPCPKCNPGGREYRRLEWERNQTKARDEALDRVASNNDEQNPGWNDSAQRLIRALPYLWEGTGEDMRSFVELEIGPPHHHNVWGSVIGRAKRAGLIEKIGYRKTIGEKAHSREAVVYRRIS